MCRIPIFAAALLLFAPGVIPAQAPADLSALTKSMESAPPEQRLAFNALLVAFTTFRDAHVRHETCNLAADCATRRNTERVSLDSGFGILVEKPSLPESKEDLTAADQTLNDYFQKVTDSLPESCPTTDCLSKSTFRDVQRDWIRYRDAWITFAATHSPDIPPEKWRIYLTGQRSAQLLARLG